MDEKALNEFQKANIIPKTIRIEENGRIKESISFPAFKFTDIVEQSWEDCDLREQLETTKYMFFVFKKEKGEDYDKIYPLCGCAFGFKNGSKTS